MSKKHTRRKVLSHLVGAGAVSFLAGCAAPPRSDPAPATRPARTALLLPLSGPQLELGQSMAKAVWLVEDRRGLPQRVEIFDTGPAPEGAVVAAQQADAAGAEVIIGPLFASHTSAVLKSGPRAHVMTLSNDDRLAAAGGWVFGVTPAHSAQAAAEFAARNGAKTIALLQPGGDFGAQSAAALTVAARANGLKVGPAVDSRSEAGLDQLLSAGSRPDSLYLPSADAASRRAAQKAAAAGVRVIGSVQWADVPAGALQSVGDISFVGADPVLFESLSASYRSALGEDMGIISGLAVDAVSLANSLPRGRNGAVQMTGGAAIKGLLGDCSFRNDRTCARELAVLQIKDGRIRKVA